jgi:hypothetical protein
VLPVGADKYEDLGGGLRRGAWIEGDYLHHIASDQTTEWRYLGDYVSTPGGAEPGSCWVEGVYLHYIDEDGDERRCRSAGASSHNDAGAIGGSFWVETYCHWIRESGAVEQPGHADVLHADGTDHSDSHDDVTHGDTHWDTGHADSHLDWQHYDEHTDIHTDTHVDHSDGAHVDSHSDYHQDAQHLDTPHKDSHSDTPHADAHIDSHTDTHSDYWDHADDPYQDQPKEVT